MKPEDFQGKVKLINTLLAQGEPANVETYNLGGKEFTGYGVQFVIDAVNNLIPVDWMFEIVSESPTEGKTYWVGVQVKFLIGTEWRHRGTSFGSGSALSGDGDSRKSAVSDAIKKGLAMWGIGNKPYRGELSIGGSMIIQEKLNPLIAEVCKENPNITETWAKNDIAKFLWDAHTLRPADLDKIGKESQEIILADLIKRVKNMKGNQI